LGREYTLAIAQELDSMFGYDPERDMKITAHWQQFLFDERSSADHHRILAEMKIPKRFMNSGTAVEFGAFFTGG
jgi:hypothetical protein